MIDNDNKLIYKNTIIVYVRMIIVTILGIISARFVLHALGASDYGLYNVVGGLIAMLNFISTAMSTTTRRFINVEMGKKGGNLNKVFNVSLLLHIVFALLIIIIAETLGVWYVKEVLNVTPGTEQDAMFVFQISTLVACLGIINIPYQSILEAYEQFFKAAVIDILTTIVKFGLILILLLYTGNALRFYAVCMCFVTLLTFILYCLVCYKNWGDVVKIKYYKFSSLYKDILSFNNYTALGALAYIGKSQGSTLLVNYFFGTIANAAFAISYQVESYVYMFVSKLTLASNPQIAKKYDGEEHERSLYLVEKNSKYTILIMILFFFIVTVDIDFVLDLWLKDVPEGSQLLCRLTMLYSLALSFSEGTNGYVQASGKIKWFQIVTSGLLLLNLPLGYILFVVGFPPYSIVVTFIMTAILTRIISLYLMKKILLFDSIRLIRNAYVSPIITIAVLTLLSFLYSRIPLNNNIEHFVALAIFSLIVIITVFFIGFNTSERKKLISSLNTIYKKL